MNSKALTSPPSELSREGKVLVQDVRDVIEQAKKMLLTKNQGELLQDFIWQAQQITAVDAKAPNVPISKEDSKQDANKALDGLKTLGTLLITNGEFRKIRKFEMITFVTPRILTIPSERCYRPYEGHRRRCLPEGGQPSSPV